MDENRVKKLVNQVGRSIQYSNADIRVLTENNDFLFIEFSTKDKENVYLNIYFTDTNDVYHMNLFIAEHCLFELNEEEKQKINEPGYKLYKLGKFFVSLKKVSANELSSYDSKDSLENIIVDSSKTYLRKNPNEYLFDFFELSNYLQTTDNLKEKEMLNKLSVENQVIDKIATACMIAMKCCQKKVVMYGNDKAIIYVLDKNNRTAHIYLQVVGNELKIIINNTMLNMPTTIREMIGYFS